jgi:hypothetical protein
MAYIQAQGTTLTIDTVAIGGIQSYSGFDGTSTEIDVTTLASTAKEFATGLEDFGSISFEMIVDDTDAGQEDLRDAKTAATSDDYVLTLPGPYTRSFSASVTSFSESAGVDDVVKATVTLRISGAVTYA